MSVRSWGLRALAAVLLGGLMTLLASARLSAQGEDPQSVVRAYYAALQAGTLDAASSHLWKGPGVVPLPSSLEVWGTDLFGPPPRSFSTTYPHDKTEASTSSPASKPSGQPPSLKVASFKVLDQRLDGERATVQVEEVYAIYGFPTRVLADLPLRRVDGRWMVDGRDLLLGESATALVQAGGHALTRRVRVQGIGAGLAGWVAAVGSPEGQRAVLEQALDGCRESLRSIGMAAEMYSADWHGRYPPKITMLVPSYLSRIPACPAAGRDTYSAVYRQSMHPVDAYTVYCEGVHHASQGLPANYPQFNSTKGYIERP